VISFRRIYFAIGIILGIIAISMIIPLVYEGLIGVDAQSFLMSFSITTFASGALILSNYTEDRIEFKIREAFLLTFLLWIHVCFFSALPFYFSLSHLSFVDSFFESVSCLTTTGASLIKNIQKYPKGLLLWRSLLQWLGGIGIVVMALTIFPSLRIGGMQLFRTESSDRSEKILPRLSQISSGILGVYIGLSVLCIICLYGVGLNFFDAFCYALSTVSTGGMALHDNFYLDPSIAWVLMPFMILGSLPLILFVKSWHQGFKSFYNDQQVRGFMMTMVVCSIIISMWLMGRHDPQTSILNGVFHTISILSTTGFALCDYNDFGPFSQIFFFILSFVGGCTGSTSGGIKIFRFQVLYSVSMSYLRQLQRPHTVFVSTYQNQKISDMLITSILTFITLYGISVMVVAGFLTLCDLDFMTSFSAAASVVGNIGLGVGELLSPHYAPLFLGDGAKWVLMFGMILGRLELLTVLILMTPAFWKD
jgi:trk system potassium uptake protein TrkH